jgi:hypothetical protein
VGGLATFGGLFLLFAALASPQPAPVAIPVIAVLAVIYGIWVLTGIWTGGWRLLIF